jgi:hypothetical protein
MGYCWEGQKEKKKQMKKARRRRMDNIKIDLREIR